MLNPNESYGNELKHKSETNEWLADIIALAIVSIYPDGKTEFNSRAKEIFKTKEKLEVDQEQFSHFFSSPRSIEKFIDKLDTKVRKKQFTLKQEPEENVFTIIAKEMEGTGIKQLVFVPFSKQKIKSKDLLKELERHESQLAISETERLKEFNRLNTELNRYRKELEKIVVENTKELKGNEERLRALSDNIPNGAVFRFRYKKENSEIVLDYAGNFIFKLFNKPVSEIKNIEAAFLDIIHPDDKKLYVRSFDKLKEGNSIIDIEFRVIHENVETKWLYLRAQQNRNYSDVIFWDGFIFDITQRKSLEKQFHLTQASIDRSEDPVYWFNNKAELVYANEAACGFLGYSGNELLSVPFYRTLDDFSEKDWLALWTKVKKNKSTIFEAEHIKKDGSKVLVEIRFNYFIYDNDEYVFGIVADITHRKEIDKKLLYLQRFEGLIVDISTRFINIGYEEVDINIKQALKEICLFSETEYAYIYVFDGKYNEMGLDYYYCSSKIDFSYAKNSKYKVRTNSLFFKELLNKGIVQVRDVGRPEEKEYAFWGDNLQGVNSFIMLSLYFQNEFLGFLGISSVEKERYWEKDELKLLQVVGDIFVGAIKRKQTEQSLLESERTYREIYNATNEAILILEKETGRILDVNQAMLEMFDLNYEKALSLTIGRLIEEGGSEHNKLVEVLEAAVMKTKVFEYQLKKTSGEFFWAEVSLKMANIHGKDRIMAIIRDISMRKKSEELLKENEEKYRMIVEGQSDLIVKIDTEGKFLFVSLSYCKMFGFKEAELLGEEFLPLVHEEDRETTMLAMEKLYKPPYSCYLEQRAKTKDGWRWLAWNKTSVLDENKKVTEIIGVGRDITYQKMVENALRESEERFRSIVQNLSDVVFLLDENANIKYVTPSSEEYLGLPVEELLGYNIKEFVHPDDRWLAEENLQLHIKGNDYNIPYELRIRHSNNTYRVFEVKSHSMLKHPSVNSVIYTISDITERKLMEKQVLDAIIKTEEKERERFAKDLHDDLGPLLSSIKMYVGMLGKAKEKEKLEYIISNLNDIVKEAIITTKDVSNDLNPHVLNNYGLVSAIELFVEKVSSEIDVIFEQDIDSTRYAPAIELSLYRISKELINNSIKHAEATKIRLKIMEKNTSLQLYYEDNGKGLSESVLSSKKATGMGLSNIISRAKSLNGKYNFYTNLSKGFKFDLNVPLIQE